HVEVPVLGAVILVGLMGIHCAEVRDVGSRQSDTVRPGPVSQKVHVSRHLVPGTNQQTVIVLSPARIWACNRSISIHARRRWVRYFQQAPEILRTTPAVGLKRGALAELGGRSRARYHGLPRKPDGRIQIDVVPNVGDLRSYISCRKKKTTVYLMLDPEVTRVLRGRLQIRIDGQETLVRQVRENRIVVIVVVWERVPAWIRTVWIVQRQRPGAREALSHRCPEGCNRRSVFVDIHTNGVVSDSAAQ